MKGGRSIDEINSLFSYTGYHITLQMAHGLVERGLLRISEEGTSAKWELTDQGRNTTLHIIAAAKAIEDGIIGKIGYLETVALKNLLKQLISETDPGLAHPWDN
ncbi:hypothetical protein PQR02_32085 [Paraburkholderia sediminicola]|uniref:Uncharacterized protein n=1 Tax=Paraburkholderia rhynchosiae TaxID=487049 RepID=A0ACC7NJ93_9BURK